MIRILVAATDLALLAGPDGLSARLQAAFAGRLELEVVGGALYALMSLEQRRADLIVSSEALEDISGRELFDLVCDDAALRQLPFILLSGSADDLVLPDHHLVLGAQASPADIIAEAFRLLLEAGTLGEAQPEKAQPEEAQLGETWSGESGPTARYQGDPVKISGTLEALTLFDLAVSLGQGGRSGRLVVFIGDAEGTLYLRGGRIIHATLAHAEGEDAVQKMFAWAHHTPASKFLFVGGLSAETPKTIDTSLDKLLLQVAVTLDETGIENQSVSA